ncbi:MAG: fibrillin [Cyanobacteria bacterium]|nr:fibrillin [Cyanobacteriota bacterium]
MLELLKLKDILLQTLSRQRQDHLWETPPESIADLNQLIADLEAQSPSPNPLDSPLLMGDWRLVYTTSRGILGLDRIPLTDLGQVYQAIRGDRVYNVAETKSVLGIEGIVAVAARYVRSCDARVSVTFERSVLGLRSIMGYRSVTAFVDSLEAKSRVWAIDVPIPARDGVAQGWLEVTYLDETLRISRGNEGSIFVLVKD